MYSTYIKYGLCLSVMMMIMNSIKLSDGLG